MKILFCEIEKDCNDLAWEGRYLREAMADKGELIFSENRLNEYGDDLSQIEILSTFIYSQVDKEMIDKMPALKLIVTRSTGFDHVDVNYCRQKGIEVCNVPFYGENSVAEYAFALLLTLARKTYEARDRIIRSNYKVDDLMGFDLKDKVFGVVGGGHIGIYAAKIARGFSMKVLVYDVNPKQELAEEIGFEYVDLDTLYSQADIISLHVPLILPTKHMINEEAFAKMKKGVVLVNTARGGIVDTNAMMEALDKGILAGACIDVLEEEELIADEKKVVEEIDEAAKLKVALESHILMDHPKVVTTFHNAFNTVEGRRRILDTTVENIAGFISGKMINQVKIG